MSVLMTKLIDLMKNITSGGASILVKWELDLWYEIWNRAGSEGLDTWHELPERQVAAGGSSPDVGGSEHSEGGIRPVVTEWEGG